MVNELEKGGGDRTIGSIQNSVTNAARPTPTLVRLTALNS